MTKTGRPRVAISALALVVGTLGCASVSPEVSGPHDVVGYRSLHALFYVVPVDGGVVLVDTGFDDSGDGIREAVAGRPVVGVLVTHSHVDHWSGLSAIGSAPVYVGRGDDDALRGAPAHRAPVNALADRFWPTPTLPPRLTVVDDGARVTLGGEEFVARLLPGHTSGSVVWLWRDVAFTGDALLGDGDGLAVSPGLVSDDVEASRRAVARLDGLDVEVLLDGHTGRTDDARRKIEHFVDEIEARP